MKTLLLKRQKSAQEQLGRAQPLTLTLYHRLVELKTIYGSPLMAATVRRPLMHFQPTTQMALATRGLNDSVTQV
jgi:hypothetical protein